MVKKCVSKILLSSLLLCSVLYLFVQCIKDDSFSKAQIEQMKQAEELIAKNVNHGSNGIFTLPVNLHKYNRNPQTKGSQTDTTYNIIVDSLIDHTKGRTQLYDNGWIYYQVPFKSNEVGIYAAIMPKSGNFADSLVRIKCYYLLVNKYRETDKMEYSVTMIPTHSYQKQNPDYDFLDKPSFSGYILYSLTDGTFVRGEAYKNGVIQDGMLKTTDNTDTQTKSTAKNNNNSDGSSDSGGTNTGTTDKDEPEQLNSVFCIAERIDSAPHLPADFLNPKVYVEFDPKKTIDIGNGGGGGNPDTRTTETQHTIVCRRSGCNTGEERIKIAHGTKFQYQYPPNYSDSCSFLRAKLVSGATEYSINGNQITIGSVGQSFEFEASYGKPSKKCQEIKALMESVPEFKSLIARMLSSIKTNGSLEWSLYAGANTNNIDIYSGKAHSVSPRKQPFKVVIKLHSHPNGNPIISAGDFSALLSMIANGEYHSVERFYYGVMAGDHLIMIKIANLNKIKQIIRQYPTKEERIRYYNENAGTKENNPLDKNISLLNQFLNSCGFLCYRAGFWEVPVENNPTGTMTIDFRWRDAANSGNIYDCYNLK